MKNKISPAPAERRRSDPVEMLCVTPSMFQNVATVPSDKFTKSLRLQIADNVTLQQGLRPGTAEM
ncbi:hypothetical protein [Mesorhizobium sp. M0586]|uniref:hypothetical protein n=1 Tax=unclassified Mesorhizobium TaxID=325217 RepID=UPI00333CB751